MVAKMQNIDEYIEYAKELRDAQDAEQIKDELMSIYDLQRKYVRIVMHTPDTPDTVQQ